MANLSSAQDLLTSELAGILSAERQLSRAIPKLSKKATSARLRQMLDERLTQGKTLIDKVDDALDTLEAPKARPKNKAAEGLLEDVDDHLDKVDDDKFIDPVLLASIQKVEHYCIAAWGTAAAMGRLLGEEDVVETMEQALEEGKQFDKDMTLLAEEEVNPAILEGDEDEEDEDDASAGGNKNT